MTFTANSQVGEYMHILSVNEMPSHNHSFIRPAWRSSEWVSGIAYYASEDSVVNAVYDTVSNTGGGASHNNIQSSIVVCFWKRIS
nr:MAG: protein of unknown function DUF859 [Bacteriophage sp.]